MLTGEYPFPGTDFSELIDGILNNDYKRSLLTTCSKEVWNLLGIILVKNPEKRMPIW